MVKLLNFVLINADFGPEGPKSIDSLFHFLPSDSQAAAAVLQRPAVPDIAGAAGIRFSGTEQNTE